jgi:hypothetical protein
MESPFKQIKTVQLINLRRLIELLPEVGAAEIAELVNDTHENYISRIIELKNNYFSN